MQYARNDDVMAERSGARTVVLDAHGSNLLTLSPVGALLWDQLPCGVPEAVSYLGGKFPDVAEETLIDDVSAFFAELLANSLIIEIDAAG